MSELYIGLLSGTSADGIDAAVVDFSQNQPQVVATHYSPYSNELKTNILDLCQPGENEIQRLGELDALLGKEFARVVQELLKKYVISAEHIKAIGSHGQTVRHFPHLPHRFTLQIGDPNTIAAETGITTVADFRRRDMALNGQGAPLVPGFHHYVLASNETNRAIVNIGGIANVTLFSLKKPNTIVGFDSGPGNVLLDAWIKKHENKTHDEAGAWGAKGTVNAELLQILLADPYFQLPPPKSTGREHFNLNWLEEQLQKFGKPISAVDVQATLVELTARSIITAIRNYLPEGEILICGGGVHNAHLLARLRGLALPHFGVDSTKKYGIDPDWVEAMAFAWLARQTLNKQPGNIPSVTGAKNPTILGGVYYAG